MRRLLEEVCDLAFDTSSCTGCSLPARIRAAKPGERLDVTFADEICEVAETQTTYITDELN